MAIEADKWAIRTRFLEPSYRYTDVQKETALIMLTHSKVLLGDSQEILKTLPSHSMDALVSDPPYGLGTKMPDAKMISDYLEGRSGLDTGGDFMGRDWQLPSVALWREAYRILKPGAVLMAFAGSRTLDLMAAGIEAAGFQYVGLLSYQYGQGFPKSLSIGKALNKISRGACDSDTVEQDEAKKWDGFGTSLKPAYEPILVFTKGASDWKMPKVPFFYTAKAPKKERWSHISCKCEKGVFREWMTALQEKARLVDKVFLEGRALFEIAAPAAVADTFRDTVCNDCHEKLTVMGHVTVKPLSVMRWLIELAVPEGGAILEPFLGSGTTGRACIETNRSFIGIERDPTYFELACRRIENTVPSVTKAVVKRAPKARNLELFMEGT